LFVKKNRGSMLTLELIRPASVKVTEKNTPSLWRRKLVLATLLTLWVSVPYYALERWMFFPARVLEPGPIDRAVPFVQGTAWLYLSLYLLLPIAPIALATRRDVRRFALDIAVIALVSHLIFLFCPTSVARPNVTPSDFAYRLVIGVDRPLNACPSLHASLAVYSALWCDRLLRARVGAWLLRIGLWTWTLAILYATLALRQHVLVDLLAGAALATMVFVASGMCYIVQALQPDTPV
jgi:hypothetical protein